MAGTGSIYTSDFWKATGERVVVTVAQALIAVLAADGFDLIKTDWVGVLAAVAIAGALSLLKAIVANAATKTGPSFLNAEQVVPAVSVEAAAEQDEANDLAAQRAIARRDDTDA